VGGFRTEWDTAPNERYDIWTVTNGGEILPGIVSPLTATMFNRYDHWGLQRLMKAYPSGDEVALFPPPVGNFFGVKAGRLCLNLGFTCAAMSALEPDIAQAMLQQFFTGADGLERFIVSVDPRRRARAYAIATRQREAAEDRLVAQRAKLYAERASGRYERDRRLPLDRAWARFVALTKQNTDTLNTHYIVSTAAGEFQVRLALTIAAGGGDPALVVGLCSGMGEVESSKPAIALYDLAALARKHGDVAADLAAGDAAAAVARMRAGATPGWRAFANGFDAFVQRYGFRGQGEADPTNADWGEEPAFALSSVRSMLAVDEAESPRAQIKRAAAHRRALEKQVRAALTPAVRPAYDVALAQAQRFTRMRELSKATWVLATRRARAPYLAMGDALVASGALRERDDLRFCTYDEVEALAAGRAVDGLRAAVTRRKRQARQAAEHELPDIFFGDAKPKRRRPTSDVHALAGLGVSTGAGPATGPVQIIMDALSAAEHEIEPGAILVAPYTDTPWTPLFIPAGAVVVETGGVLSHAATVAREFGIPAVVMVKDATRILRDGDVVTVDGAAGTVTIVARAPS
jgi:pyruvate,water dikinase